MKVTKCFTIKGGCETDKGEIEAEWMKLNEQQGKEFVIGMKKKKKGGTYTAGMKIEMKRRALHEDLTFHKSSSEIKCTMFQGQATESIKKCKFY